MSLSAWLIATRDHLRDNLTNFYSTGAEKYANCLVMPDERTTPSAGREFIGIYGNQWSPVQQKPMLAADEAFGFTIAVTHRTGFILQDRIGETVYSGADGTYINSYLSLEGRLREILGLVHGNYELLRLVGLLEYGDIKSQETVYWSGSDAKPREVGPEHFLSDTSQASLSMQSVGQMMEIRFSGAGRLQTISYHDKIEPIS